MRNKVELTVEADKFAEMVGRDLEGGEAVRFHYDSSFGGEQKVAGVLRYENGGWLGESLVAVETAPGHGRRLKGEVVESLSSGRKVGHVSELTVTMDYEDALEAVTRHWNYDVDDMGDKVAVQMWDGTGDDMATREVVMNRLA